MNNSAPATKTRKRPRQNAKPPKMRETEGAKLASERTMSMNEAPRATNEPASIAKTNALPRVRRVFANPMCTNASCVFAGGSITVPVSESAISSLFPHAHHRMNPAAGRDGVQVAVPSVTRNQRAAP